MKYEKIRRINTRGLHLRQGYAANKFPKFRHFTPWSNDEIFRRGKSKNAFP